MMMLSVVHGFRSKINGNAEVSTTGPTSRVNLASSVSSGHLGATVPHPRSFLGLAPPLAPPFSAALLLLCSSAPSSSTGWCPTHPSADLQLDSALVLPPLLVAARLLPPLVLPLLPWLLQHISHSTGIIQLFALVMNMNSRKLPQGCSLTLVHCLAGSNPLNCQQHAAIATGQLLTYNCF